MLYLIMPDRFANGNQKTTMLLQRKNTIAIYPAEDTAATFRDNKNLDYISSLGATAIWSTPLCEDNDKAYSYHTYAQSDVYKIDPVTEQMLITCVWPLRCIKRHEISYGLCCQSLGIEHWMILPTQDWIHQFENYTQTIINALR
jgi:hypothetical protein